MYNTTVPEILPHEIALILTICGLIISRTNDWVLGAPCFRLLANKFLSGKLFEFVACLNLTNHHNVKISLFLLGK